MLVYIAILIVATLGTGILALRMNQGRGLQFFLVFSGAYLFSITIVHLLPEVFESPLQPVFAGVLVLAGFYIQQILEFFTQGVEHGHFHQHSENHSHGNSFAASTLIALCFHALLEGTILVGPNMETIFTGVLLHKIPAAIALVSVLKCLPISNKRVLAFLVIFTVASPLGILLGDNFPDSLSLYLLPMVAGSFLQISTTIVFETSADHKFNVRKLGYGLFGALLAVISELYLL